MSELTRVMRGPGGGPDYVVTRTGGGRFDPAEPPIYFLASKGGYAPAFHDRHPYFLIAVNELDSKADRQRVEDFMDADPANRIFLDSGIYWLTNRYARAEGLTMDQVLKLAPADVPGFDELLTRYIEIVKAWEDRLWGYVELDQGGMENKRKTRAMLHAEGLRPIPVYHPLLDGWDYFDELATTHDRLCFGNIVQASRPDRLRLIEAMAERHRLYPDLWVHVLGMSPTSTFLQYHTNSCDASAWLAGLIWVQGYQTFGFNTVHDLDDEGWRYRYGSEKGDGDHGWKGAELSIQEAGMAVKAWRAIIARRAELLGEQRWPALRAGEPTPQPARRKDTP